jgi:hypothetical protein
MLKILVGTLYNRGHQPHYALFWDGAQQWRSLNEMSGWAMVPNDINNNAKSYYCIHQIGFLVFRETWTDISHIKLQNTCLGS